MIYIIIIAVCLLLLTVFAEKGEFGWAMVTFVAGIAICTGLNKAFTFKQLFSYISDNIGIIIAMLIAYIMCGVGWSLIKWKWYCRDWYNDLNRRYRVSDVAYVPDVQASNNKGRITGWMLWWPTSFTWFILHDPITKFYNFLYRNLTTMFDSISLGQKEKILKEKTKK